MMIENQRKGIKIIEMRKFLIIIIMKITMKIMRIMKIILKILIQHNHKKVNSFIIILIVILFNKRKRNGDVNSNDIEAFRTQSPSLKKRSKNDKYKKTKTSVKKGGYKKTANIQINVDNTFNNEVEIINNGTFESHIEIDGVPEVGEINDEIAAPVHDQLTLKDNSSHYSPTDRSVNSRRELRSFEQSINSKSSFAKNKGRK